MRAAILQCDATGLATSERLSLLETSVRQAESDLVVCPELYMSGYAVGDDIARRAEPADGPFAKAVAAIARRTSTAILYGYPERCGDIIYNSALLVSGEGRPLANHRKLAIPPGFERRWFATGESPTLVELGGLRLGILVCYDAEFPEPARTLALAGADAILVPTALSAQWDIVARKVIPTRAFENGVYIVYANHAGREGEINYLGASCIVAPDGADLARAGRSGEIIRATLSRETVATAQTRLPYLADRAKVLHAID
ncbi:MAG: hypothetical protein GC150_08975 [Rhizobiales bacterium]|nr:hypothetical protein [Hyphomicrobiales bacterium]